MPETGQAHDRSFSLEQPAAEFAFERLYCARQRWLCDTATSGCPGETLFLAECEEIKHLVRLHRHGSPIQLQAASLQRSTAMPRPPRVAARRRQARLSRLRFHPGLSFRDVAWARFLF